MSLAPTEKFNMRLGQGHNKYSHLEVEAWESLTVIPVPPSRHYKQSLVLRVGHILWLAPNDSSQPPEKLTSPLFSIVCGSTCWQVLPFSLSSFAISKKEYDPLWGLIKAITLLLTYKMLGEGAKFGLSIKWVQSLLLQAGGVFTHTILLKC